jgi:hypothetical protein
MTADSAQIPAASAQPKPPRRPPPKARKPPPGHPPQAPTLYPAAAFAGRRNNLRRPTNPQRVWSALCLTTLKLLRSTACQALRTTRSHDPAYPGHPLPDALTPTGACPP